MQCTHTHTQASVRARMQKKKEIALTNIKPLHYLVLFIEYQINTQFSFYFHNKSFLLKRFTFALKQALISVRIPIWVCWKLHYAQDQTVTLQKQHNTQWNAARRRRCCFQYTAAKQEEEEEGEKYVKWERAFCVVQFIATCSPSHCNKQIDKQCIRWRNVYCCCCAVV